MTAWLCVAQVVGVAVAIGSALYARRAARHAREAERAYELARQMHDYEVRLWKRAAGADES